MARERPLVARGRCASTSPAQPAQRTEAHPYGYEQLGRSVLVSGSLRVAEGGELLELQLAWLYVFDESGRLRRARHFGSAGEARAAAAAARASPPSRSAGHGGRRPDAKT
jgi:hypothetical protein